MSNEREELIRARAFEIWEAEGSPAGRDHDHWRQAEQEIAEAAATPLTEPVAKAKPVRARAKAGEVAPEKTATGKSRAKDVAEKVAAEKPAAKSRRGKAG